MENIPPSDVENPLPRQEPPCIPTSPEYFEDVSDPPPLPDMSSPQAITGDSFFECAQQQHDDVSVMVLAGQVSPARSVRTDDEDVSVGSVA